ncbi:MAG TPA: 4-(cytidine 5'-diphospho)-2-C-methyl-D-erythritol kinase [Actinomycetota bacterium]|nr:4-(cytidine 5'-diphospho)-2-C-methyl-D-erythritol kinase [Actinomycetota bacterium]
MSRPPAPLPNTRVVRARAKVNLFLRVHGRRQDGYHEVETAIVPISLADRLEVHAVADPTFRTLSLALEVIGEPATVRAVPADESNLVLRAADALARRVEATGFADVLLEKRIPVAAGLGGGSADAAAALHALNDLWGSGLDDEELRSLGADVGSDVPALLAGRPALARGRGESIEPLALPSMRWVLMPFRFGVSTRDAYSWWDEGEGGTGPDPGHLIDAAREGDVEQAGRLLFNDLEQGVLRHHAEIGGMKQRLLDAGAAGVVLCGSGPTLAALVSPGVDLRVDGGIEVES